MKRHYCTLFDSAYLPRGVVLYESLRAADPSAELHVVCFDARSRRILEALALPSLHIADLEELEGFDPELYAVKPERSRVEYFWTATPSVVRFALDRAPIADSMTYLDADLMFLSSPEALFEELGDDAVLIVPHRYSPAYRHLAALSGVYNVELLVFKRDGDGLRVLDWWRDRCLEWCFDRVEDGKLGDQRYLESFPNVSTRVHALEHIGGGVAPWNSGQYTFSSQDDRVHVDDVPLVFYHFQSLSFFRRDLGLLKLAGYQAGRRVRGHDFLWTTAYPLAPTEIDLVWDEYVARVADAIDRIRMVDPTFDGGIDSEWVALARSVRSRSGALLRSIPRLPRKVSPHA